MKHNLVSRERSEMSRRMALMRVAGVIVAHFCGVIPCVTAQSADAGKGPQDPTNRQLQQRVEQLEIELKELKNLLGKAAPAAPKVASADPEGEQPDTRTRFPSLEFHGFGDVSYVITDEKDGRNSFALGQLDLFVTSRLSENFDVLSEIVFEAGEDNHFSADVERLLLRYTPTDYFHAAAGRYHTAIGFQNTAYHHGTWFQTAVGRPFIFDFEDDGGILPLHQVGVTINGQIPSGSLGLRYVLEVGNGRNYSSNAEPVLNVADDNGYKAVNLALSARPDWLPGLQFGVSAYHDRVTPEGLPRINQTIVDGYAVYQRPKFEWLNEVLRIRNDPQGSATTTTWATYSQVSSQFGRYRPYLRYQYSYSPQSDLIFSSLGRSGVIHGPSVGLRYDFNELATLKLQYDHYWEDGGRRQNQFTTQVGFTF